MALAAAALAVAGALGVVALTRDRPHREGPPVGRLLDRLVATGVPGALVLARTRGSETRAASGVASRRPSTPMTATARFRVGSVTKTFVATVALQLVAEGRLRLDEPVERRLPGLVPGGRSITVRDLLAHTSGLFDYTSDPEVLRRHGRAVELDWTPRRLVRLALSHPRVFRPPGSAYAYSSTNYVLLGLVVERATGRPLGRELEGRLFRPLGLRATAFVPGSRIPGVHAHAYAPPVHDGIVSMHAAARDQSLRSASWAWASGAIVSSARDLATFFSALLGGRLLPRPLLAAMERPTAPSHGRYGLGLAIFPTPCGRVWGHTGNVLGYVTAVWNSRDGADQVVLMANAYPLSAEAETAFRRVLVGGFCS